MGSADPEVTVVDPNRLVLWLALWEATPAWGIVGSGTADGAASDRRAGALISADSCSI